jgi:ferrous iron transport protein A
MRQSDNVTSDMTLDLLPPLRRAEIVAIDWSVLAPDEGKRLRAMGIDAGARVAIAHRGIFAGRDPIAIEIGRMTVAIRRSHARAMTVTEL